MKNFKKLVALLLLCTMCISVFASCSETKTNEESASVTETEALETEAETEPVEVEKKKERPFETLYDFEEGEVTARGNGQRITFKNRISYDKSALADELCAAKERADAKDHFIYVDRLDHIIVGAGYKAKLHRVECVLGGYHQNGSLVVSLAERADELVAVHFGHHNI